jgi:hypothetical protein
MNPIYVETENTNSTKSKSSKKQNLDRNIISLIPLSNHLSNLIGVMTRTLIRGTNKEIGEIQENFATKYNIFNSGINPKNLDPKSKEGSVITEYLSMLK